MRFAAVGDNCMDVYTRLGKAYPGGNPVNVAVYMRRLGVNASYTGMVGDDDYGRQMKKALAAKRVDISHLHTCHGKTATTLVELVNGDRVFGDYDEGVMADFKLTAEDIDFLCTHDLIHSGVWGKIEKDLPILHKRGKTISFDFADKFDHDVVKTALPFVDYAFFSYTHEDDFIRNYLKEAQARGPKIAIATLGENGSIAYDGQGFTPFGIVPVKVVDTMGAGDSFIAGFMRGTFLGFPLRECLALGAETAAETLKYMGAWMLEPDGKENLRVAAMGDNCMDVYPRLGRQYPTGNIVNFAIHMRQLGFPTSVISVTGNDSNGRLMQESLAKEGLDLSHLRIGDGPTAITSMDMDGKDRVHGDYLEGVLEDMVFSKEDLEFASEHDLVHTAFWGKADRYLAELRSRGSLISFDYATKKDAPLVGRTLPYVDYAFFSLSASQEDTRDFLEKVKAAGPRVVVATFGSKGSMAYDGKDFYTFGIYPARVENTVGAGDAFIAGFMYGTLMGLNIEECLKEGARLAVSVVEIFEPWAKSK